MTAPCASALAWETLVDCWAGELASPAQDAVDAHLMGCAECSASSARVASITETLRALLPPLLSPSLLAELRARGMRVTENHMLPGERKDVPFPADTDLLLHCLGGLDLTHTTRVDFSLHVESSGALLVRLDDAAFERSADTLYLACQRHFASLPPDTVAEVRMHDASGAQRVQRYTILHRFA